MKFTKEHLKLTIGCDGDEVIEDKIVDTTRWDIVYNLVFKHDDKFYQIRYRVGATEYQDYGPFDGYKEDDLFECQEVVPVEKTVVVYKPKKD